jgi:hypothetical protein
VYNCTECKKARHHKGRNCRRFFPTQAWNKSYRWSPEYRGRDSKKPSVTVKDVVCDECPVSHITPTSRELIASHNRNKTLWDVMGIQPKPPGQISAIEADVVMILELERMKAESAMAAQ